MKDQTGRRVSLQQAYNACVCVCVEWSIKLKALLLPLPFCLTAQEVASDDANGDLVDTMVSSQSDRYDHRGPPGARTHSQSHPSSFRSKLCVYQSYALKRLFFFFFSFFCVCACVLNLAYAYTLHTRCFVFNLPSHPLAVPEVSQRGR